MTTTDTLVMMANQIARNLEIHGEAKATAEMADHVKAFWDPSMLKRMDTHLAAGGAGLSPIARAALQRLGLGPA
jgi:formate dehydrogenase subunit delta